MTNKSKISEELNSIRNQIVNIALIFASVLGVITYVFSFLKIFQSGIQISHITDFISVAAIVAITIFRNRLSITFKGTIILIGLFTVIFIDVFQLGLLSANKIFIILIPFFALTTFSFKRSIYIFILAILLLIIAGIMTITSNNPLLVDGENHILSINAWIINILIIIIATVVSLIIIQRFNITYIKIFKDLQRKNFQLSQSEQNYREVFNGSTDAIFVHELNGAILDVNQSMLNMYGYKADEVKSIPFEDLCSGIPPFNAEGAGNYIKNAINEGKQIFDWHAKKKNGDLFWAEVALKKIKIGENERVLAIVRDINEKKEISLQLENYKDQLEILVKKRTNELNSANKSLKNINSDLSNQKEELSLTIEKLKETQEQLIQQEKMASLGILTSGVGHEINNPLNFIQAGIYSIDTFFEDFQKCDDICEHKDQLFQIVGNMQIGVDRVSNIVNGLNHFSRQSRSNEEDCNIHEILDNCLLILNNQYKHRIEILKEYSENDITISANEGKLHQVFTNILINSIHAIDDKGEIKITTKFNKKFTEIIISDTGMGISEEDISKIFDPFFTTKEAGKGTGLGLSISYGIIQDLNGDLSYSSKMGKGTKVFIKLPIN